MRYLLALVLLLAALLVAAGCTSAPPSNATATPTGTAAATTIYTAADSGKTVPLGLQQTLSIRLPENPTTGFVWNATVTDGLVIVDTAYSPDAQATGMVGVGGTRNWTVRGAKAGTQQFSAVYARPWETNQTAADQFNLTVQVS